MAATRGSKHPNATLNESKVATILRLAKSGWTERQLAARYGISRGAVAAIRQGRTWRHVGVGQ